MRYVEDKEEDKPKRFSTIVTLRDPKSGQIVGKDPYILRVCGENHAKYWERPAGSGNLWNSKGEPNGRWVVDKDGKGRADKSAKHVAVVPPETQDQKLKKSLVAKDAEIAQLQAELEAIKKENDKTQKPQKPAQA